MPTLQMKKLEAARRVNGRVANKKQSRENWEDWLGERRSQFAAMIKSERKSFTKDGLLR